MKAIVAVDSMWGIGRDGDLLIHLPKDLAFFKEKTIGNVVIMGRKTLESLPGGKPLPDRRTVVLTRNKEYIAQGCSICVGEEELLKKISDMEEEEIFVAGGSQIYDLLLEKCNEIFVTKIEKDLAADKYFNNLDENPNFRLAWQSNKIFENGVAYSFNRYEKIK